MSDDFEFCITYTDVFSPFSDRPRRVHVRDLTGIRLFNSQSKAYKWLATNGLAHHHYEVSPWHDLQNSGGSDSRRSPI